MGDGIRKKIFKNNEENLKIKEEIAITLCANAYVR